MRVNLSSPSSKTRVCHYYCDVIIRMLQLKVTKESKRLRTLVAQVISSSAINRAFFLQFYLPFLERFSSYS